MFWDNFERICKEAGTSPSRACVDVNIGQNRPSNWKKTGTLPKQDELALLAERLGCTVADFFKDEEARENDTFTKVLSKKLSDIDDETKERGEQLLYLLTFTNTSEYKDRYQESFKKMIDRLNAEPKATKPTPDEPIEIQVEQSDSPTLDDYERDFIRIYEALDPKTRIRLMNAVYEFDSEEGEE